MPTIREYSTPGDSVKRQHGVEKVIGALLKAEIAAKHARSINYQMGIAKLPLAKELADLSFEGTPINAGLIEQLGSGVFLETKRNASYTLPRNTDRPGGIPCDVAGNLNSNPRDGRSIRRREAGF